MSSSASDYAEQDAASPKISADMSIEEVMRVMDVASTMRREQEVVEREFNLETSKQLLRDKLKSTAQLTGEPLTHEQIEAAVNWYYDRQHEYKEPAKNLTWYLAHLYVARVTIISFAAPIILTAAAIWGFWFAPFAPFSKSNLYEAQLRAANDQISKRYNAIESIALTEDAKTQASQLSSQAKAHLENKELQPLKEISNRMQTIESRLKEEFELKVMAGENVQSAIRRDFDEGSKISGYYLIVQAKDAAGNPIKRRIQNIEDDKFLSVDRWAEKIPKSVYDRLKNDKLQDGILNETLFGTKQRGRLDVQIEMLDSNGQPIKRSGQITNW